MTPAHYPLLWVAVLAGCSSLPSYNGPTGQGAPATIEKFGSSFSLCGLTAAFTKDPICDARVLLVDGEQTSTWAPDVKVSPGQRSLRLFCSAALGPAPSDGRWASIDYTVELEPGGLYRVEARWDKVCHMRLVDAKTGKVITGNPPSEVRQRIRDDAIVQPVTANQFLGDDFLRLQVPNSEGWVRMSAGPGVVSLAKRGSLPGETFAAQVMLFGLEPADSVQELTAIIKREAEKDIPADRFSVLTSKFEPNETMGYPCVRHDGIYEDRKAKTTLSTTETLTLQVAALYCRHPQQAITGFAAIYSHRGAALHPTFESEANAFVNGVVVPTGAQPDGQPDVVQKAAQGR